MFAYIIRIKQGDDKVVIVYGTNNCGRCSVIKTILKNKGIEFKYKILDDLEEELQDELLVAAKKSGISSFPIIVNQEGNIIQDVEVL